MEWNDKFKVNKIEVFNFNDKDVQKRFHEMSSNITKLSGIFDSNEDINIQTKKFIKKLDGILHQSFKKIKINGTQNKEIDDLFKQQKQFKKNVESKRRLQEIEEKLADKTADK